jgi:SnoaL-like domain
MADFEQVWRAEREVTRILFEYGARLDLGDVEGVGELFRHGVFRAAGTDGGEGAYQGVAGVTAMFQSFVQFYDGSPRTKHVTTNVRVDVDDDAMGATSHSYFTVLQATDELPLQIVIAGRYRDRFEQRDGQWWIVDRMVYSDLFGDLHAHMTRPI